MKISSDLAKRKVCVNPDNNPVNMQFSNQPNDTKSIHFPFKYISLFKCVKKQDQKRKVGLCDTDTEWPTKHMALRILCAQNITRTCGETLNMLQAQTIHFY